MVNTLLPLLMVIWVAWGLQALLSAIQVRKFLMRRVLPGSPSQAANPCPLAIVIVPFKGIDADLPGNVRALCEQSYPNYRVALVVESRDDPAYPVLNRELARYPARHTEVLIAGESSPDEGQKVHNQLTALAHIASSVRDEDILVFADSDAIPGPDWLGMLVIPLVNSPNIGLTTGYRWVVPSRRGKPSVWTHLAIVINSSVASFFARAQFAYAWGGAMALRAKTARRGDLCRWLKGALTDDYQFTKMVRSLGLRVYFVPGCLIATPAEYDLRSLANFAHRQHLITRVYEPKLFYAGLLITGTYVAGAFSSLATLIYLGFTRPGNPPWWLPLVPMLVVFWFNQWRATSRRAVVRHAFSDPINRSLRITLLIDRWATPVWMTLHFLFMVRAAFGRGMVWRGVRYELAGPQRVRRVTKNRAVCV